MKRLASWSLPAAGVGFFALALVLRLAQRHEGLIYPDGYQYLLMARGIGEHLRPVTQLGVGGELFVPNVDAALKPLFPALVALASALGAEPRAAAGVIAAVAAAATVPLVAAVALRVSGSRLGAAVAAGVVLASPALAHWSGFAGPEPLAHALALGAVLALLARRGTLGGVLVALAVASRPEYAILAAGGALAAAALPELRPLAGRTAVSCSLTLAAVLVVLRPPLASPVAIPALLPLAALAAGLALVLAARAAGRRVFALAAVVSSVVLAGALGATGELDAAAGLWRSEAPLLALGAAGLVAAALRGRRREVLLVLAGALVLGACYAARNTASERYFAQLLPAVAIAAGLGVAAFASLRGRAVATLVAGAALLVTAVGTPPRVVLSAGLFPDVAAGLPAAGDRPLVSAAPDAYATLLPGRAHRSLRSGERGLILLDGAQRAYEPGFAACGRIVARVPVTDGFARPDGTVDDSAAVLVDGVARRRGDRCSR